jgi:cephalosporin-C deacetylase-like acetyl esterase
MAAEVGIKQNPDRSVSIEAVTYRAEIGRDGNIKHLTVNGESALSGGFVTGNGVARPSISVINNVVAIRSGAANRIEYTFAARTIGVETDGYELVYNYNPATAAVVIVPGGKGGPVKGWYAGSTGFVLRGGSTVQYSMPFHFSPPGGHRLVPTWYCNSRKNKGDSLKFALTLGEPADAALYLTKITLEGVSSSYGDLNRDGSRGYGLTHFPQSGKVRFTSRQKNLGTKPFSKLTYRLTVDDHYFEGKEIARLVKTHHLAAQSESVLHWDVLVREPGFYYAAVELLDGERELTKTKLTFAVDLARYRPALTRPEDFRAFWRDRLARVRSIPFDPVVKENEAKSNADTTWYDMAIRGPDGKMVKTHMTVPKRKGKHTARFGALGTEDWICLDLAEGFLPHKATYTVWKSKDDNNLLECILLYRRLTDYLVSREDVGHIYLTGASRTGPIQFINAALDPRKIVGVDIHVPTSAGASWPDKKYRAWGGKPDHMSWEKYTAIHAYVDPVNHAPDMTTPWICAWGLDDPLAYPQGIEAMFQHSPASYKRMSRDAGGHQCSNGFQHLRKQFHRDLGLEEQQQTGEERRILREH